MNEVVSPTLLKFQKTARLESRFLISEFGFKETLSDVEDPFRLVYCNEFSTVSIIGRSFGFALDVIIKRIDYEGKNHPFIGIFPLWAVLKIRDEKQYDKRYHHTSGQLKMLQMDAKALRDYCQDLLRGDFTIEPQVSSLLEKTSQEARDRLIEEEAQWKYSRATSAANNAFQSKDFVEVIKQLKSVEDRLTPSQFKKLAIAEKKAPNTFLQKAAKLLKINPSK